MRAHFARKNILRAAAAVAFVIYVALCLSMWLAPADDENSLDVSEIQRVNALNLRVVRQLLLEKRNLKRDGDQEITLLETDGDSNQEDDAYMSAEQLQLRPELSDSGVGRLKLVPEQYDNRLLNAQGPFELSDSVFGKLTSGANGTKRFALFPDEDPDSDRIANQMRYIPLNVLKLRQLERFERKLYQKTILVLPDSEEKEKESVDLEKYKCPVVECEFTFDDRRINDADVVVWMRNAKYPTRQRRRPKDQVWIIYQLESPGNMQSYDEFERQVNYTASYRRDSTIVTPYFKFLQFGNATRRPQVVNYAAGKSKKVAWFVSNCDAKNQRLEYAKELAKYIDVDVYGMCGDKQCPKEDEASCFQMLNKDYKFYLSFENSNCRDYITEKFFLNGLQQNVLPIVMGAHPDDYRRVAPEHSYIHVDDFASVADLATYLLQLDRNDSLYNQYFEWKGTGEFINTHWWCRLCAMAHAFESENRRTVIDDIDVWWHSPDTCVADSWRKSRL